MTTTWAGRAALAAGLWVVFAANGREIGAGDTIPAILLPIAIARGDGIVLDRFEPTIRALDPTATDAAWLPPYYAARKRGHLVSRYPLMPVLVALPLTLPQIALLDRVRPGWDDTPAGTLRYGRWIAKNAAATVAALAAAATFEVVCRLGLGGVALPTIIVAALGSPLWTIAAQSPWQHGVAALALAAAILALLGEQGRVRLLAAGFALAILVATRPADVVFALPLAAWVLVRRPRAAPWLCTVPILLGGLVVTHNLLLFGTVFGGQTEIESWRLPVQGLAGTWGNPLAGAAGTLLSPSRGLFVFCPWVPAAALVALPGLRARLRAGSILGPLLIGLAGHFVVVAAYSNWWAGWCFGPRYWTEAIPVFGIVLAVAFDEARRRGLALRLPLYATGVFAIAVQAVGAACYPSSWNATPAPIGSHHDRLWDWTDTELTRELREGPHPREFPLLPPAPPLHASAAARSSGRGKI